MSPCIYLSTLGADCEQTAICMFIGAFATVIVTHKNPSFEAVKFYLTQNVGIQTQNTCKCLLSKQFSKTCMARK